MGIAQDEQGNVDTYTADELNALGIAPVVEGETADSAVTAAPDVEVGSFANNQPSETQGADESAAPSAPDAEAEAVGAEPQHAEPQQRAIDRIPKDKKGNRNYEAAPVEDTAAALIENAKGDVDDAIETAEFMRKKTESRVEKAKEGCRGG